MPGAPRQEKVDLQGPGGTLEALLETPPAGELQGMVVVCHPHPMQGGTMNNKVAHTLARAFLGCGFAALRFNFRGVGESEGQFAEGEGELEDALAAFRWMRDRFPALPGWLAGFSFGAAIAIRAATEAAADGLVSVAPAVSRVAAAAGQPGCPWLVVQGEDDELVEADETIRWLNGLEPGPELVLMPGTGHFFHGRLVPLREAVARFVGENTARN